MRRSGAPLSLWMAQVELPLAILAMDAEAAHVARFAAQAVRLTALARRCPFNWDGLAEGAWFAAYVRAYCPAGRYEPRERSAVCAWARRAQDV